MANSATRMLLPRNGNSFPLHLLRGAPTAAGALLSVSYLKPNPETRIPSLLAHLPVNDSLIRQNDSPTGALLDWRRAEAADPEKKKKKKKEEEVKEENDGKRTEDLDDVNVFSDDDDYDHEFDNVHVFSDADDEDDE